ncbi:MAG: thiamine pyrophosphate-dependent dehydrogenase E1 component subunit alpha [Planctomycetes bacterium]|nr:thiamine pyrophosphate-dependent dehydrogenase E1 component subunit alpha [Planctomycetota bacterium]
MSAIKSHSNEAAKEAELTKKQYHDLLYYMWVVRKAEDRLLVLHRQGKLIGTLFRCLGQEATAVGSAYALEPQDVVCPMIRDLGSIIVKGHTIKEMFCQYFGRETAPTKGRDGNHHIGDIKKGTISCISMMGATIPVVAGAAFAKQHQGIKAVGLAFVGDGGTSTGDFHEALNLASVLKAPLILITENNNWAYSTPTSSQMNIKDIAIRAQGYGIPGYILDGNDVLEVYHAVKKVRKYAVEGNGPVIIEVKTMRMRGHAEHDDFKYVPKELLEEWKKKDPIDRYIKYLKNNKLITDSELTNLEKKIDKEVEEAEKFAVNSPLPRPELALEDVYQDQIKPDPQRWWEI